MAGGEAACAGRLSSVGMANESAKRKVVSRRVTPTGGAGATRAAHSTPSKPRSTGPKDQHVASKRYTPPVVNKKDLPSPVWVPVVMFGLLIAGSLIIILNYVGVLGGVSNVKLVIGLALILGGIVAATQYR